MEEELLQEDELALNRSMGEDIVVPDIDAEVTTPEVTPSTVVEHLFPAPFQSQIGKSSINLAIKENDEQMRNEYNDWWHLGLSWGTVAEEYKDERNQLRDNWYQKYHGMSYDEYQTIKDGQPAKTMYGHDATLGGTIDHFGNVLQGLSAPGLGLVDFGMDAVGLLPGLGKLDDKWDEATKLDNPVHQAIRTISSVVIPSIITGGATNSILAKTGVNQLPWLAKHLTRLGAWTLESQIIAGISDTSEDDNAARVVSDLIPGLFGPEGWVPLPEAWKTADGDSPAVRRQKNMWEAAALSWVGVALGSFIDMKQAGKVNAKKLRWFEPKDELAQKYYQTELLAGSDNDKLIRIAEIEEVLSTKKLSKQNENILINELMTLQDELGIVDGIDDAIRRSDVRAQTEADAAALRKANNPDQLELDLGLDPDLAPELFDPSTTARSVPTDANVARNMADTTAIKSGNSVGDPAPIITESMREKGLMIGDGSRDAVMGVAEQSRIVGRFDALVDGFRYSTEQMNAAAWAIYKDIISADNIEDVRKLFLDNRDVKNMLLGKFRVETINEEQARAAAFAMRDLVDRFLGRSVTESSARVMDTLGREVSTLGQAMKDMEPFISNERTMNLILDKMLFLMDEYALNKYISGWQLRNKNWFDQIPPGEADEITETILREFKKSQNSIHAKNRKFTKTLKALKKRFPQALRPLVDAYTHTDGDVDSLAKLYRWAEQQVTPWGAIKSPNPKEMNLFARGLWGVNMNNTLSGKSPLNAAVGNLYQVLVKPITSFLGHGFWGAASRDFDGLRRSLYYYGSVQETHRRALTDAWTMMKKAHKDPETMLKVYRKDFQLRASKTRKILDEMRAVYEKDNNWGMLKQIDLAMALNDISKIPGLRYGMTALVFPDAYTTTVLSTYVRRMRAYDDVFYEFGWGDPKQLKIAESRIAKEMFDKNGLPKDPILRAMAGEIQLNLDDGLSKWLTQATTAYPITKYMFMFPRTQSNWVKTAASWTPISLIPGMNKYSKTIYARTDEAIAAALREHGIDMASTPNARAVFENLRADYTGRLMFSGLVTTSLFNYAMSGNIRGNGHYQAGRRMKERDQFGYEPKTINIGGTWVSYKGIPGLDQILSIIGDMAYYSSDLNESMLQNWQAKVMWTLSASFLNETPLSSFEPIVSILNGDLSGFNRIVSQITRASIPLSSGLGVLTQAIDSAQKDIKGEMYEYLFNRLPGLKNTLPNQIDIWTGQPLNDIDNPWLRILNAVSPFQVSHSYPDDLFEMYNGQKIYARDVIKWLQEDLNYAGLAKLNKDSTGSYEYSTSERELINKLIGEQEIWRLIVPIMMNPTLTDSLDALRAHRQSGQDLQNEDIQLKLRLLPIYKEVDQIVKNAQKIAEGQLSIGAAQILDQLETDQYMEFGNVEGAAEIQRRNSETRNLLEYGN